MFFDKEHSIMSKNILGIDVAKKKLDVALMFNEKTLTRKFDNTTKGFKLLAGWLASLRIERVHACMEATGSYSEGIAEFLHERGHCVSVVNPLRIKGYAKSYLQRNKTDPADARTIAGFCLAMDPRPWHPLPVEAKQLQSLTQRIDALQEMMVAEQNRLQTAPREVHPSLKRVIRTLEKEIENVRRLIKDHIDNHPEPYVLNADNIKIGDASFQPIQNTALKIFVGEKAVHLRPFLSESLFRANSISRDVWSGRARSSERSFSNSSLRRSRYLSTADLLWR